MPNRFTRAWRALVGHTMQNERTLSVSELAEYVYGTKYGPTTRYNTLSQLHRAQRLFDNDGFAGELVGNVVDSSVGTGAQVDFGSDAWNAALRDWAWNPLAPLARIYDLERFMAQGLLRDGDEFLQKAVIDGMAAFYPLPAEYIRSGMGARIQGGVVVDELGRPVEYLYNPTGSFANIVVDRRGARIPAAMMVHVYQQDYAGQVRGRTWLGKALRPLEWLDAYHEAMIMAGLAGINAQGYWTATAEAFSTYGQQYMPATPEDQADADVQAANKAAAVAKVQQRLLSPTSQQSENLILPEGLLWNKQEVSGLDAPAISAVTYSLMVRAARGMGVSPYALTADYGRAGFLAARMAYAQDVRFYQRVQQLVLAGLRQVIQHWVDVTVVGDARLARQYQGFELTPAAFPYVDPVKDAKALETLVQMGVTSPQQIMRDRNGNPVRIMEENAEFARWRRKVWEETGIDPGALAGLPPMGDADEEDDDGEQDQDEDDDQMAA